MNVFKNNLFALEEAHCHENLKREELRKLANFINTLHCIKRFRVPVIPIGLLEKNLNSLL